LFNLEILFRITDKSGERFPRSLPDYIDYCSLPDSDNPLFIFLTDEVSEVREWLIPRNIYASIPSGPGVEIL